jgi:predicted dehydrogenase
MTTFLKVGIAGYGVVGKRRRQFIDAHPELRTVAVCDRTFAADGALDDGLPCYTSYQNLLDQDLDVLFVCLTNDVNPDATIAGLEKGLHVFCEKPPGRDLDDIARVRVCEGNNPALKLKYGFNHRYHDSVRDALKLAGSGALGGIINLRGIYGKSKLITFGQSSWRTERKLAGGGVLLDQGIHMVDLLRLFAGEFEEVQSFISNSHWQHDVEDNAYALMRTADGKVAILHSSATQWRHRFSLEIALERGAINLSGILSGSKSYGDETMTVAWSAAEEQGNPKEETTHYQNDRSWSDEIDEFAQAILNDEQIKSGSSDDALKSMELVYRIYRADTVWRDRWGLGDQQQPGHSNPDG